MTAVPPLHDWRIPSEPDVSGLPAGMPAAVARVLAFRGIDTGPKLDNFLHLPNLPHDPGLLPDIDKAVARLRKAVDFGECVGVFGDFDVDGITGTAIMCEGLNSLGARAIPYIPNRSEEGHGLSEGAILSLVERGATLIVTVDCGITDAPQVEFAAHYGADVIITDHHVPPDGLPNAVACVNAHLHGSEYPFRDLCGAGLAYKVIHALHLSWPVPHDPALLELAALGTVADLVPLHGENRYLVSRGVEGLRQTQRAGLVSLLGGANISQETLTSETVAFQISPRLNAAGRMGDPIISYELLTCKDGAKAEELAQTLETMNQERRNATQMASELALDRVASLENRPAVLLVADEEIPQGVAGLVASRLVDRYHRPAVVLSIKGDQAVASARSIPEFNIINAITSASDLLVRFGGHSQAAGFTVQTNLIGEVAERLEAFSRSQSSEKPTDSLPPLEIDAGVSLPELNWEAYDWLERLAPFGKDNRRPVFATLGVDVLEAQAIGRARQHMRFRVGHGGSQMTALAFNQSDRWNPSSAGGAGHRIDLAFTLMLDSWHGQESLALRVVEFRPSQYTG